MSNKKLSKRQDPEPKHLSKAQKRSILIRKIVIIICVIFIIFGVVMFAITLPRGK